MMRTRDEVKNSPRPAGRIEGIAVFRYVDVFRRTCPDKGLLRASTGKLFGSNRHINALQVAGNLLERVGEAGRSGTVGEHSITQSLHLAQEPQELGRRLR